MDPHRILAVNVGSSSLRVNLWRTPCGRAETVIEIGGIGGKASLVINGRPQGGGEWRDHTAALDAALAALPQAPADAAGHRIVHGGAAYRQTVWADDQVLADLSALAALDPLHIAPALAVVRRVSAALPRVPQAVVFDTAFHVGIPPRAFEYAVPAAWRRGGVRRYGFHGLACADAVAQLGSSLRDRAVLVHLGAGCSATAILRGRSVDTTMGLTPLEGLVMATRSGDLDPAIPGYVQREHGLTAKEVDRVLNQESGLLGLSGVSADMKVLLGESGAGAALALDVFCYRAAKAVGALAVALGGCDQLIFTGGIGEHAAPIRARIVAPLGFLGAQLDEAANTAGEPVLSAPASAIAIQIVRVDEGRQIAAETAALLGRGGAPPPAVT